VDPEADWDALEFRAEPGDRLVVVTDGLAETMSPDGHLLGRRELRRIILAERSAPLKDFCPAVLRRVAEHRGDAEAKDDMSILALEV
jgi:serine phosphatase RsbU (regulator of sigma subunit)